MSDTDVLVVGAGPTGLVLALWLARSGVRVRVVDRATGPGTTSRALAVQARTLELYRQLGLAQAVVEAGLPMTAVNLWVAGQPVARVALGEMGVGVSPFPYLLIYPQDEHERLLIERLRQAGVEVERETELLGFEDDGVEVRARLRTADGADSTCQAAYLAGCDGARSTVREGLGTGFPGGTYAHLFYVADVEAHGPVVNGELHATLDDTDFLIVFPLAGGRSRLIGALRDRGSASGEEAFEWKDVNQRMLERVKIDVDRVNWFSTYHVHHRVATHFRRGRVFLLGDAAHIHSPVGGQGMNTGIGDAVNLAWKLTEVLAGRAEARLLDTYEPERIQFARRLVATTDRLFEAVTRRGRLARMIRIDVVPRLVPPLFTRERVRRFLFRTVSQTGVSYRDSALAAGRTGPLHGGDRLPWIPAAADDNRQGGHPGDDNFTPLLSRAWQVHVPGRPSPALEKTCAARGLPLHRFAWRPDLEARGLRENALYLVRPDGYIGLADPDAAPATLDAYLDEWKLRPPGKLPDRPE